MIKARLDMDVYFFVKHERDVSNVKEQLSRLWNTTDTFHVLYHKIDTGDCLSYYDVLPDKKEPVVFDIVDEDAELFKGYYRKRLGWYKKIGSEVVNRRG